MLAPTLSLRMSQGDTLLKELIQKESELLLEMLDGELAPAEMLDAEVRALAELAPASPSAPAARRWKDAKKKGDEGNFVSLSLVAGLLNDEQKRMRELLK